MEENVEEMYTNEETRDFENSTMAKKLINKIYFYLNNISYAIKFDRGIDALKISPGLYSVAVNVLEVTNVNWTEKTDDRYLVLRVKDKRGTNYPVYCNYMKKKLNVGDKIVALGGLMYDEFIFLPKGYVIDTRPVLTEVHRSNKLNEQHSMKYKELFNRVFIAEN